MSMLRLFVAVSLAAAPDIPLVDVGQQDPRLHLDMRYATDGNFARMRLYPVARCLLREDVAAMLRRAQDALEKKHPGFTLVLKDCYRPVSAQRQLFDAVKGTSQQGYVADPNGPVGSVHTYGAAVDLSVLDVHHHELDMGTPFDFLGALAQPRYEARFIAEGKLTAAQRNNRQILRDAMAAGGFKGIRNEWWHFDAFKGNALRDRYQQLDTPLDMSP